MFATEGNPRLGVLYQIANLLQVDVKDLLISNVDSFNKNEVEK